jgi:hypothetical protein
VVDRRDGLDISVATFDGNAGTSATTAQTPAIACTASVTPSSSAARAPSTSTNTTQYAVIAANGTYNNLFPALFCAVIPCASGDAACFEDSGANVGTAAFQSASLSATITSAVPPWTIFPQGAAGPNMQPMLDDISTTLPQEPNTYRALYAPSVTEQSRNVLSLALVGLQYS